MARKKEQNKKIEDLLDISSYALDDNDADPRKTLSARPPVPRKKEMPSPRSVGVEELSRLIEQDAASSRIQKPVRAKEALKQPQIHSATIQKPAAAKVPRPSQHVLDLRKHYLIEKHGLHTIERPAAREGFLSQIFGSKQIRWHQPVPVVRPKPRKLYLADDEAPQGQALAYQFSARSFATFCTILLLLVIPVPGIKLVRYLSVTKGDLFKTTLTAFSNLQAGTASLEAQDYFSATKSLTGASSDFLAVQQSLDRFAGEFSYAFNLIPYLSQQLDLARAVTTVGGAAADIGSILSLSLSSSEGGRDPATTFLLLGSHFKEIQRSLASVHDEILDFSPDGLGAAAVTAVSRIQDTIDVITDGAGRVSHLMDILHHITGGSEYSRYLVLFQNDRELRPTGGFLGSFALVDFSRNSIHHIEFPGGGTYDLAGGFKQHLIPPEPISVLNQEWNIWDANWWYDFPTSARKIAWFYRQSGGPTIDGVIAVNARTVQNLLLVVGPIELPEYGITVTADSFYDVIQQEIELDYDKTLNQPKRVLKDLMPLLLERIFASANYREILGVLTRSLSAKDVQISIFNDPGIAQLVSELGWDGHIRDGGRDYLAVITTNIAGGKSDASIYDTIDHEVSIERTGSILVTARVKREHRADPNDVFAYVNHVDYMRFYVPLGSELVTAAGFQKPDASYFRPPSDIQTVDEDLSLISGSQSIDVTTGTTVGHEFNKTVFGNWLQIQPGETKIVTITYRLPFSLRLSPLTGIRWLSLWDSPGKNEVDSYTALFQKQSGKNNVVLNSSLKLSDRYKILWSDAVSPAAAGYARGLYSYSTTFDSDTGYTLLIGAAEQSAQP